MQLQYYQQRRCDGGVRLLKMFFPPLKKNEKRRHPHQRLTTVNTHVFFTTGKNTFSQRLFVERSIYLGEWIDSRWKTKRQSTTSSLLHTLQNFWEQSRRRRIQQRRIEAEKKYTIMANGSLIRTSSAGSTWPGHKKGDYFFGKQGLTPSMITIQCPPTASNKWHVDEI